MSPENPYRYGLGYGYGPGLPHAAGTGYPQQVQAPGRPRAFSTFQTVQPSIPQAPRLSHAQPRRGLPPPLSAWTASAATPSTVPRWSAWSQPRPSSRVEPVFTQILPPGISTASKAERLKFLFDTYGNEEFTGQDATPRLLAAGLVSKARNAGAQVLSAMARSGDLLKPRFGVYRFPADGAREQARPQAQSAASRPSVSTGRAEPVDSKGPAPMLAPYSAPAKPAALRQAVRPEHLPQESSAYPSERQGYALVETDEPAPAPIKRKALPLDSAPPERPSRVAIPAPLRQSAPSQLAASYGPPTGQAPGPVPVLSGHPGSAFARPASGRSDTKAPVQKAPVYEERQLTMSRTDFVRLGDGKGEIIDSITVSHPMVPDPRADDAFLFRDPEDPTRVLDRFAAGDGSCHPLVSVREVHFQPGQLSSIKALCGRDGISCTRDLQSRLKDAVSAEVTRLIEGRSLKPTRLHPRKLKAEELPAHEKGLAGQYGVFVNLSVKKGQQLTLANGRILGLYAGAVLEKGVDEAFSDTSRGTEYDMALSSKRTMSADGFANAMAFFNTALKPGSSPQKLQYDDKRINAALVNFRIRMTDKDGELRDEHAVALIGLNNLYDSRSRPAGEVRVSYGDSYTAFDNPRKDVPDIVKKEVVETSEEP